MLSFKLSCSTGRCALADMRLIPIKCGIHTILLLYHTFNILSRVNLGNIDIIYLCLMNPGFPH
jgi:hypothetical protein